MSEKMKEHISMQDKDVKKVALLGGSLLLGWAIKKLSWMSVLPAALGGLFVHHGLKKEAAPAVNVVQPEAAAVASAKDVVEKPLAAKSLTDMSKKELYELAAIRNVSGRSKMSKAELLAALQK